MPLGSEVGLVPGDFIGRGPCSPFPIRGGGPQIFGPFLLWPNGWMDQDGTWHRGRPQLRRLCVRWVPSPPPQTRGRSPPSQFSAHFSCGKTAECIKIPLGMAVDLSPGDCVRWGRSPLVKKGAETHSPIFSQFLLWPNGSMHQDATWCGGRSQARGPIYPSPQFLVPVCCGQTAEWIKMALGTEVGICA